jgi:hypothetical protein
MIFAPFFVQTDLATGGAACENFHRSAQQDLLSLPLDRLASGPIEPRRHGCIACKN